MQKCKYLLCSFKEVYINGKGFFFIYIFKTLINTAKIYLSAWLSKQLLNEIITNIALQQISLSLVNFSIVIMLIDILMPLINSILDYHSEISATKYNNAFTLKNSIKCSRLKFQFHDNPTDSNELRQFLNDGRSIINLYCQAITIIVACVSFVVSMFISMRFSIAVTLFSLLAAFPAFFVRRKNKNADYELEKDLNNTERIIEYYKSIHTGKPFFKEVHLFDAIPYFTKALKVEFLNRLEQRTTVRKAKVKREIVLLFIYALVNILINFYIIAFIIIKKLTIGDYTYYTSIINNLKNNSDMIVTSFNELFISIKRVENYYAFFNDKTNEYEYGSQPMPQTIDSIKFLHVSFRYPHSKSLVLDDVSFEIKKNEKVAIAGVNGAGKTTIINLLLRFYEPISGQILINGKDANIYNLQEYWSYFSCMFQQANLYDISVRDNLLLGHLTKEKTIDDSTICYFLASMGINVSADFLNRNIGKQFHKDGVVFSPGQAQKINVARTLLYNAPVIIFDEPSSSMDALTEDSILESAFSCAESKMLILISHRLSNLKKVDKIIYLEHGQISESGSHEELMENHSRYSELYSKQSNKYL